MFDFLELFFNKLYKLRNFIFLTEKMKVAQKELTTRMIPQLYKPTLMLNAQGQQTM